MAGDPVYPPCRDRGAWFGLTGGFHRYSLAPVIKKAVVEVGKTPVVDGGIPCTGVDREGEPVSRSSKPGKGLDKISSELKKNKEGTDEAE